MSIFDPATADRTERPTQRRRREARARGLVARSAELMTAARSFAVWLVVVCCTATFLRASADLVRSALTRSPAQLIGSMPVDSIVQQSLWAATQLALPLAIIVGSVLIVHFGQTGWLWLPQRALPDADRLSPISGLNRIASSAIGRAGMLFVKSLLILGAVGWLMINVWTSSPTEFGVSHARTNDDRVTGDRSAVSPATLSSPEVTMPWLPPLRHFTLAMGVSLLAWGSVDYVWHRRRFERSLRMTKAELRQELKDAARKGTARS